MEVRWLPEAADDLEGISDWLRANAPHVEQRIVREIYRATKSLQILPFRGRQTARPETRELVLIRINYVVVYRVRQETIQIMRVRHMARKPLN